MNNNYITIFEIQPLVEQGLKDVQIAKTLNLHKTSVGKIRKGIIKKSRPIGIKKMIRDRPAYPIWDHIGIEEVYPLARAIVRKSRRICNAKFDDLIDFVLNQMFFTNKNSYLIKKMGKDKKRNRGILFNVVYRSIPAVLFRRYREERLIVFPNGKIGNTIKK